MKGGLETCDDAMGPDSMESHDLGDMHDGGDGDGRGPGSDMGGMEGCPRPSDGPGRGRIAPVCRATLRSAGG